MHFGVAAAEVVGVGLRKRVGKRGEEDEVRSCAAKVVEVVAVVEAEGCVHGNGNGCAGAAAAGRRRLCGKRRSGSCGGDHGVKVTVLFNKGSDLPQTGVLFSHEETEVAAFDGKGVGPRHPAEQREGKVAGRHGFMPGGSAFGHDDACEPETGIVSGIASDEGGNAAGHAFDVGDQNDGGVQETGDVGCAGAVGSVNAVVESHDSFDDGDVRTRTGTGEAVTDAVLTHHERVQVS